MGDGARRGIVGDAGPGTVIGLIIRPNAGTGAGVGAPDLRISWFCLYHCLAHNEAIMTSRQPHAGSNQVKVRRIIMTDRTRSAQFE